MEFHNEVLYHHGIKGQRWGVRRYQNKDGSLTDAGRKRVSEKLDEYGNNKRSSLLFRPQLKKLDAMSDSLHEKRHSIRDNIDDIALKYVTKGLDDTDKKVYSLNYYNDKKAVSNIQARDALDALDRVKKRNKTKSEQFEVNVFGSDFINKMSEMNLNSATENYQHYSKKVDDILNDIGDIKLSKITSRRTFRDGDTTYSWTGEEYVRE